MIGKTYLITFGFGSFDFLKNIATTKKLEKKLNLGAKISYHIHKPKIYINPG